MHFTIPLNNLNTFACAARVESFQLAAEQLHITPSAVSHQIRKLEQQLGYKLFERLDKQVRLTAEGQQLFQSINRPLHELFQASEQALTPPKPTVHISSVPMFATRWLMPRLSLFQTVQPNIELSIQATTDVVNIDSRQWDCAIRLGDGSWSDVNHLKLIDGDPVVACRTSLLERLGGPLTPKQLLQQPLIDAIATSDRWKAWFAQAGIRTDRRICVMKVQTAAQAIEACLLSDLFILVDKSMIEQEISDGQLTVACDLKEPSRFSYHLVWSKQQVESEAFLKFKAWLLQQAGR